MGVAPVKASMEQLERIGMIAAQMVAPGQRVGLGSGAAAQAFVRMLGRRVHQESLEITGVPTSLLTQRVAQEAGVPLTSLEQTAELDIAIDGADEVDPHLNLLKGGGGNLTREKVVATAAKKLVIVVGQEKLVTHLGQRFPVFIEVIPFALPVVMRKISAMGAHVSVRRQPDGSTFLTDNSNPLLHCRFEPTYEPLTRRPAELDAALRRITGVVETGLFARMAAEVIVANFDGAVERLTRE